LRFLQDKRIQRVGGRQEIEIETRILAATHIDLAKALEAGRFREDLYYRLAVVTCKLPPLRERGDDILLLARDFLKRFGAQSGRGGLGFNPRAVQSILSHSWPGNVRELQNRVHRAVVMTDAQSISEADLELESLTPFVTRVDPDGAIHSTGAVPLTCLKAAREQFEREMVSMAMERQGGNISAAAKELGISRPTLYELMSKLGISKC
jgi:two-component system NtrC family response regulator